MVLSFSSTLLCYPILESESEDERNEDSDWKIPSAVMGNVLKKPHVLPKDILDIKQLKTCSIGKFAGGVSSIHFHPHANILLATGMHKNIVIFQVNVVDTHIHCT